MAATRVRDGGSAVTHVGSSELTRRGRGPGVGGALQPSGAPRVLWGPHKLWFRLLKAEDQVVTHRKSLSQTHKSVEPPEGPGAPRERGLAGPRPIGPSAPSSWARGFPGQPDSVTALPG